MSPRTDKPNMVKEFGTVVVFGIGENGALTGWGKGTFCDDRSVISLTRSYVLYNHIYLSKFIKLNT